MADMDLLGNEIKTALTAPQDAPRDWMPTTVFFGKLLPRTARDYKLEKAADELAREWRRKYSLPEPQQEPML